jgi:hypothetical protein
MNIYSCYQRKKALIWVTSRYVSFWIWQFAILLWDFFLQYFKKTWLGLQHTTLVDFALRMSWSRDFVCNTPPSVLQNFFFQFCNFIKTFLGHWTMCCRWNHNFTMHARKNQRELCSRPNQILSASYRFSLYYFHSKQLGCLKSVSLGYLFDTVRLVAFEVIFLLIIYSRWSKTEINYICIKLNCKFRSSC